MNKIRTSQLRSIKSYEIRDNLAFTEDNVLIEKIVATKIPKNATKLLIKQYFNSFGNTKEMEFYKKSQLCTKRSKMPYDKVIVTYETPSSIIKLLKKKDHVLNTKSICVLPCDSWLQPSTQSPEIITLNLQRNYWISHMENLGEYCLMDLFKEVPMSRQAFIVKGSERLSDFFQIYCKRYYQDINLREFNTFTVWEMYEFLSAVGHLILRIQGVNLMEVNSRLVELIGTYCKNIEELNLNGCLFGNDDYCALFDNITNIRKLCMDECDLPNVALKKLKKMKNLEILELNWNQKIDGDYISLNPNITHLSLYMCRRLDGNMTIRILKNLKKLKYLNICGCFMVEENIFNAMAKYCESLETLITEVSPYVHHRSIARIKNLKILQLSIPEYCEEKVVLMYFFKELVIRESILTHLYISHKCSLHDLISNTLAELKQLKVLVYSLQMTNEFLRNLKNSKSLEFLQINHSTVNNHSLEDFVINLPTLKTLDIQYCNNITLKFLNNIVDFFDQQPHTRTESLLIYYRGSGIFGTEAQKIVSSSKKKLVDVTREHNKQAKEKVNFFKTNKYVDY